MTEPNEIPDPKVADRDTGSLLSRRHLLMLVSVAAGGLATAIVGLPVVGFLLAPLFRKEPAVWRDVGALGDFPVGLTSKVTFEDSSAIAWGGKDSETANMVATGRREHLRSLRCRLHPSWLPRALGSVRRTLYVSVPWRRVLQER